MRCIVTGAAGFIGSNLTLALEKKGHEVIAIANLNESPKENLSEFKGKFIQHDLTKPFEPEGKIDAIFHQAAITDPRFDDDEKTLHNNLESFKLMLELAKKQNAKLIYASSASMYGLGPAPQKEDQPKHLMSAYATSKLINDEMGSHHWKEMHIVGLRYFNVFGPKEGHKGRPASMIHHIIRQIKEGKNPKLFIDGTQKRDHIYVKDIVKANLCALQAQSGVYNVGTGIATTFSQLLDYINEALGTNAQAEFIENPYKGTYQTHTQADTTLARKYLKFEADYTVLEAIKDYVKWIHEQ